MFGIFKILIFYVPLSQRSEMNQVILMTELTYQLWQLQFWQGTHLASFGEDLSG